MRYEIDVGFFVCHFPDGSTLFLFHIMPWQTHMAHTHKHTLNTIFSPNLTWMNQRALIHNSDVQMKSRVFVMTFEKWCWVTMPYEAEMDRLKFCIHTNREVRSRQYNYTVAFCFKGYIVIIEYAARVRVFLCSPPSVGSLGSFLLWINPKCGR